MYRYFYPLIVLLAGLQPVAPALSAQNDDACEGAARESARMLANRYAPILWFAPGEQYFPTIPFFTAFDGIDNDSDGKFDFEDLDEVAPFEESDSRLPSLDALIRAYWDLAERRSIILFRVRDLTQDEWNDIHGKLEGDRELRQSITEPLARVDAASFQVIEYFVAYPWPHYEPAAFMVFLPRDSALADQFRVHVGTTRALYQHNNVLVLAGEEAMLESHPSALVELAGHSLSPDISPLGRFDPGVDVNWHIQETWGIRDVFAAEPRYHPQMTLPRDSIRVVRLFPPDLVDDADSINRAGSEPLVYTYSLLPLDAFQCLAEALASDGPGQRRVKTMIDSIAGHVNDWWEHQGLWGLTDTEVDSALGRIAKWNDGFTWRRYKIDPENVTPWLDADRRATSPTKAFTTVNPTAAFTMATIAANGGIDAQVGFSLPVSKIIRASPAAVQLSAGFLTPITDESGGSDGFIVSLAYRRNTTNADSWYARLSLTTGGEIEGSERSSDWSISGGYSRKIGGIPNLPLGLEVRLGLRAEIRGGRFERFLPELSVGQFLWPGLLFGL